MNKTILAAVIILATSTAAMADASNGVPSPFSNSNHYRGAQVPAYNGYLRGLLNQNVRVPQVIQERGDIRSRKYGAPVGHCTPVKRSNGGLFGNLFGHGYVTVCK